MADILTSVDWSNPWLVGIGTGLGVSLAAFLVKKIAQPFLGKKEDKERQGLIVTANHEVLMALRPSIAESVIPKREIIESLTSSTARKYGLERTELSSVEDYADDLIKEVIDSSFIANGQKLKYCSEIYRLKKHPESVVSTQTQLLDRIDDKSSAYYFYRQRVISQATNLLAIIAGLMAAVVIPLSINKIDDSLNNAFTIGIALITTVVAAVTAYTFSWTRRRKNVLSGSIDILDKEDPKSKIK